MIPAVDLTRPAPLRIVSATTLVVIIAWAALGADTRDFGVLAYPAIIALQTAREWAWRLEATANGLHERPGIGPARDIPWKAVEAVLMPNSAWWRINPVLKVVDGPNVQLTPTEDLDALLAMAVKKGTQVIGSADSISLSRTLLPWIVLLSLSSVLLGARFAS